MSASFVYDPSRPDFQERASSRAWLPSAAPGAATT
jgi:hypothetical protein